MTPLHDDAGRDRVRTSVGIPVGRRPYESPIARKARLAAIRLRLAYGACLAAFDAGIPYVRDIAGEHDRAHLVQIEDEELVEAIDRDRELRRVSDAAL